MHGDQTREDLKNKFFELFSCIFRGAFVISVPYSIDMLRSSRAVFWTAGGVYPLRVKSGLPFQRSLTRLNSFDIKYSGDNDIFRNTLDYDYCVFQPVMEGRNNEKSLRERSSHSCFRNNLGQRTSRQYLYFTLRVD